MVGNVKVLCCCLTSHDMCCVTASALELWEVWVAEVIKTGCSSCNQSSVAHM